MRMRREHEAMPTEPLHEAGCEQAEGGLDDEGA